MRELRVLVVEDNAMNRRLMRDILQAMEIVVLEASDADEGLRLARAELPALILMDISLPGMDGLTATRILRSDPQTGSIPVCAVTAHAMPGDQEAGLAAGCDGYLTKPVNLNQFREIVLQLLARGRSPHAAPSPVPEAQDD